MPQKHDKRWQKRHARKLAAITSTTPTRRNKKAETK
jgi:hypothetical protein